MANALGMLRQWGLRGETAAAAAVGLALALVLWPMPGPALDLLLAANLAFSVVVLLLALFAERPAELGSLPEAVVLSSLGRVALCLGVARRILHDGAPGAMVTGLGGQMTAGGADVLSGLALLAVLGLAAFLVVTAGVMRLAEVAARFALDALPGRQMALDAALGGGRLEAEAGREEARRLEAESGFYGAMDGVARFLRGEALATALIVALTPVAATLSAFTGGSGGDWTTYLPLAVGHGMAIMIPATLVGSGAAVAVARAGRGGGHLTGELVTRPFILSAAAVVLVALGLLPGAARLPLLAVAALAGAGAWALQCRAGSRGDQAAEAGAETPRLRLGLGLIGLLVNQELLAALGRTRAALADELGFAAPAFAVSDDEALPANGFAVYVGSREVASGAVRPGQWLGVSAPGGVLPPGGVETMLPDGSPAAWLGPTEEARARELGCRLLRPVEVLALHVEEAVRRHAGELLDLQRVAEMVSAVRVTHPVSVAALESAGVEPATVREVGRLLLQEGIFLADRVSLIEALAQAGRTERRAEALAEAVRPALSRTITNLVAPEGSVGVITLAAAAEEELAGAAERAMAGPVSLPPARAEAWHGLLRRLGRRYGAPRRPGVLLCGERSRRAAGQLAREAGANLRVVRSAELSPLTVLETIYRVAEADLREQAASVAAEE